MIRRDLGTRSRAGRLGALGAAVLLLALLVPSGASARTITVGPHLRDAYPVGTTFLAPSVTLTQAQLSDPEANVISPVDGVVVRWRLASQANADVYALRILRPTGSGSYTGAGASAPGVASTTSPQSFSTSLPIQAGDAIGLDMFKSNPSIRGVSVVGLSQPYWNPILGNGTTLPPTSMVSGLEFGFNAEVQPAPRVVLVGPASGPTAGGTSVTIAGSDFAGVTGVKFGSISAASFAVNSEAQITATAPAAAGPGPVGVSVTTVAGTSPPAPGDQFTYAAPPLPPPTTPTPPPPLAVQKPSCLVPKLVGKKLKAVRKALGRAHCKLGKVAGEKGEAAKVVSQGAKPGASRAAGSAVSVRLG